MSILSIFRTKSPIFWSFFICESSIAIEQFQKINSYDKRYIFNGLLTQQTNWKRKNTDQDHCIKNLNGPVVPIKTTTAKHSVSAVTKDRLDLPTFFLPG